MTKNILQNLKNLPLTQNEAKAENSSDLDEIKCLKKEILRLTQERDLLKKAAAYFASQTNPVKYAFIDENKHEFAIKMACRVLKVSRSAYYEWTQHRPNANKVEDEELKKLIRIEFDNNRATYGTRRIKKALENQAIIVSRRRIGRLMSELGLLCKTKKKFKA